ncbi:putative sodium-coupled neutral amino acid transporter 11 [Orchesella cincta]|uniref:Putative sodium-coupled neutral amino acid transporter 11 n=1 Tax=Orchesella cincta TaxID=48709 RepID=A0A1D2NLY0_ORCCI|nr:putative sodium-coupled neutral amino acid transporter 11 [Orchesella cincta]
MSDKRGASSGTPAGSKKATEKSYILENKRAATNKGDQQKDGGTGTRGKARSSIPSTHSSTSASRSGISSGATGSTTRAASNTSSSPPPPHNASNSSPVESSPEHTSINNPTTTAQTVVDDMSQLVQQMDIEEAYDKSSLSHASFNYINSIIGSGIIGMPYALHQAGLFAGLALMIVVAIITDYSLVIMVKGGQLSGSYTYQGMMEAAFGRPGFYILSFIQFVYPVIAMISYNVIVGDTLTKVLLYFSSVGAGESDKLEFQREAVVLLATAFITLPLSLYKHVAKMSKVSFLSLVSIGIILLSIIIRLGSMDIRPSPDAWRPFNPSGMIQAIGVYAFAFMCHHNTFMIYSSMKNTSQEKWQKVTHISIGSSLVISLVFALVGYATFTGHVQGDLLENYCWDDSLINISRLLFCLTILLTYPLECFVARDVIQTIFFNGKNPSTTSRHFSITLLIVLGTYVASISTDCLGVVLELNGILAAMPLAYILPALCYIKLEPSPLLSREKFPAIATALFGTSVSLAGLVLLLTREDATSGSCSHGRQMDYCLANQTLVPSAQP